MRTKIRSLTPLLAAAGVVRRDRARASRRGPPQCTTTAPNTTQCQTNGSTQIVTSPQQNNWFGGWPWWGGGGIVHRPRRLGPVARRRWPLQEVSSNLTFLFAYPDREWVS